MQQYTNCARCGASFKVKQSRLAIGKGKYCSTACYHSSTVVRARSCETCGKRFLSNGIRKHCSYVCRRTATLHRRLESFYSHLDRQHGGCWVWTGDISRAGYGEVYWDTLEFAHRRSWIIRYGSIPDGMCVCHHCDNPPCCNVDHLFLGTKADNLRDMAAKDRSVYGTRCKSSKLNPESVVSMRNCRSDGMTYQAIADSFGVELTTAYNACKGITWARVKGGCAE